MRSVIVTGGSRGIGLAIAAKLAGTGYRVIAIARNESEQLAAVMRETAPDALDFRRFDLSDIVGIPGLVMSLRREFGPIYGLVNNAAIGTSGILATMRDAQIEELVRLNTLSPLVLTKHVVRAMMAQGKGRIVNVSSVVAMAGYRGVSVYGASKAALIGFTRSLAREVGPAGINVNAVAPGFIDTDMTRGLTEDQRDRVVRRSALQRLAEPDDVANAVAFLLGDEARNITGAVLTVDAGNIA
jgi:3-oxoacyl-[acyl-carrier protein] reductase